MEAKEAKETVEDIVAEFREMVHKSVDGIIAVKADVIADRIEAAWKREKSQSWHHREMEELILRHEKEVAELKNQTGNTAAMREAMAKIWDKQWSILPKNKSEDETLSEIITIIEEALSVPPRNCDVGTALEQTDRFWGYCNAHSCNECPARGGWRTVYIDGTSFKMIQCGVLWEQMPYEEDAKKEKSNDAE